MERCACTILNSMDIVAISCQGEQESTKRCSYEFHQNYISPRSDIRCDSNVGQMLGVNGNLHSSYFPLRYVKDMEALARGNVSNAARRIQQEKY